MEFHNLEYTCNQNGDTILTKMSVQVNKTLFYTASINYILTKLIDIDNYMM